MKYFHLMLLLPLLVIAAGCTSISPTYQESVDNVNKLRSANASKVMVGKFTGKPEVQVLSTRGNSFESPYNSLFSDYIREAVRMEIERAGLLDSSSPTLIEGVLEQNEVDAGVSTGSQKISVRFSVRKTTGVVYDKAISVKNEWGSSFAGAVALPLAHGAYPATVSMLLEKLFSDPQFIAAIR
jgi:hypothetical protein